MFEGGPRRRIAPILLLAYFSATQLFAADFTGTVVSVLDGDTIEVLNGHHAERVRLSGIDCPEKEQAFGNKAKHGQWDGPLPVPY